MLSALPRGALKSQVSNDFDVNNDPEKRLDSASCSLASDFGSQHWRISAIATRMAHYDAAPGSFMPASGA